MTEELKPLSRKHKKVLDEYLVCFVQWQAYQKAYPKVSYDSARSLSSELFANPNFSAHLEARLNEVHMSANEALKLLADIAHGDVAQVMDVTSMGFSMDMAKAKEAGLTKLIKKVKQKTTTFIAKKESEEDREVTELEVELYSAHEAIRDILKIQGKFTDRVDVTSGGEKLQPAIVNVYLPDNGRDKKE